MMNAPLMVKTSKEDAFPNTSTRATSLAKVMDRLPAGQTYIITLYKPDIQKAKWSVRIETNEVIQVMELECF